MGLLRVPEPGANRRFLTRETYAQLAKAASSAIATVVVASVIIFGGLSAAPGDPALALAGNHPTKSVVAAIRHSLGLDRSLPDRYWRWLTGIFDGKLGVSTQFRESVNVLLAGKIATTFLLVAFAFVIVIIFGIGVGLLPSLAPRLNSLVTVILSIGIALPSFIAALILIQIVSVELGWLPVLGTTTGSFLSNLRHLTLPAFALAISWCAYVGQITRASIQDAEGAEHVETARARGLRPLPVFRRHVLRNAALPIATVSAVTVAGLVTGTIVIETVFGIDGIGQLLVQSVLAKDYNVVLAVSMIFVCTFVIATSVIDFLQLALDPRVRGKASA